MHILLLVIESLKASLQAQSSKKLSQMETKGGEKILRFAVLGNCNRSSSSSSISYLPRPVFTPPLGAVCLSWTLLIFRPSYIF
jgi:hypothetical protein